MKVVSTFLLTFILLTGTLFSALPIYASTENNDSSGDSGSGSEDSGSEGSKDSNTDEPETEPEPEPEAEPNPEDTKEPIAGDTCQGGPPGIDGCPPLEEPEEPEPIECKLPQYLNDEGTACIDPQPGDKICVGLGCPGGPVDPEKGCNDGSKAVNGICPLPPLDQYPSPKKPLPYCDLMPDDFQGSCHDRKDFDDITKLYPCNDGTQKKDWHDCVDASNPDWPKHCKKDFDKCKERSDKVIKIIKNINIVKKINSVEDNGDLNIEQSIVAINYDEGAGINCFFGDDNDGACETFDVTKDPGKEPLLQIVNF